jgi:hypothetical protein
MSNGLLLVIYILLGIPNAVNVFSGGGSHFSYFALGITVMCVWTSFLQWMTEPLQRKDEL